MASAGSSQPSRLPIDPAIRPGLAGESQLTVTADHLAPHTPKFSTPAMVMLMEQASYRAVLRLLHPSQTVVGYEVNVKHLAPDVMRHRLILSYEAEAEEVDGDEIVRRVLDAVEVP